MSIKVMFFDIKGYDELPDYSEAASKFEYGNDIKKQIMQSESRIDSYENVLRFCTLVCGYEDNKKFYEALKWILEKYNQDFERWKKSVMDRPRKS